MTILRESYSAAEYKTLNVCINQFSTTVMFALLVLCLS